MDNYGSWVCFTCGQPGHLKSSCPQMTAHPAVRGAAAEPPPYKRLDTIECPVCEHDWVAKFTVPVQMLSTLTCPWCRKFELHPPDENWPKGQPHRRLAEGGSRVQ